MHGRVPWHCRIPGRVFAYTVFVPIEENLPVTDETEVDATGHACPMPLLMAKRALNALHSGQRVRVLATDSGSVRDFQVFVEQTGHQLLESEEQNGVFTYLIQKA